MLRQTSFRGFFCLRTVEAVYGIPCRWDPTLSVEQIEALKSEP